jgi:hypothetical protein
MISKSRNLLLIAFQYGLLQVITLKKWHFKKTGRILCSALPSSVIRSAASVQFKHEETGNGKTHICRGQGCNTNVDHTPAAVCRTICSAGWHVWFINSSSVGTWLVAPLINVCRFGAVCDWLCDWLCHGMFDSNPESSECVTGPGCWANFSKVRTIAFVSRYLLTCSWLFLCLVL